MIRALASYLPIATAADYASLGGKDTHDWINTILPTIGLDDTPLPNGENEISVLGLPYGGVMGGKDSHGQYFNQFTDFMDEQIPHPPVLWTHGTQTGHSREPVGTVTGRWYDRQGGWFRVKLDPLSEHYSKAIAAYHKGRLFSSTGVVPASYDDDPATGFIKSWLVGELSLVDLDSGFKPVNILAITKSQIKAEEVRVLFTDYYGDAVMDDEESIVDQFRALIRKILRRSNVDDPIIESTDPTAHINEGQVDVDVATGIKAEANIKCDESPLTEELETMSGTPTEKCEPCEEAARLATELEADLQAKMKATQKCARCPDAIRWVRAMVDGGKLSPTEAFGYVKAFRESDETFDVVKAEIEGRGENHFIKAAPAGADIQVAGGTPTQEVADIQKTVNRDWVDRQKALVGAKPVTSI